MKPLFDQNHYELLELSRDAPPEQVEQAFRMAESTYADDSLAGYSVFGPGEAVVIRERIATAFRVLSDPEARAVYDAELAASEGGSLESSNEAIAFDDSFEPVSEALALKPEMDHGDLAEFAELEERDGEFDGARLRRSRLRRGVEIEDISRTTKINPTYLRFIEEDRFSELPAPVYVRGFVRAYADCVGLDATKVATSYMAKFAADGGAAPRGRFLSGR